jgi:hypothetical protein
VWLHISTKFSEESHTPFWDTTSRILVRSNRVSEELTTSILRREYEGSGLPRNDNSQVQNYTASDQGK